MTATILSSTPFSSRMRMTPIARASTMRQRIDRLLAEHEHVERVAVVAEGPRDEAVVGRVVRPRCAGRGRAAAARSPCPARICWCCPSEFRSRPGRTFSIVAVVDMGVVPRMHRAIQDTLTDARVTS